MSFKTTDICDDHASEVQVCKESFQSYGKRKSFAGPISTVKVLEDNILIIEALESIPTGNVLIVDGEGSNNCAVLGDRLAGIAEKRGLAGIIIYGFVRDTVDLGNIDVGILALGSNPLRSGKEGKGERDIPVTFGDVKWKPGHYVYADEDGVIVAERKLN